MLIRPATLDDATTIVDFQIALARETESLQLDPSIVQAGVSAVYADSSKGRYYVGEVGGQVVGSMLIVPEWSDWRNGTVLWIHSVYILPDFRRRGLFTAMYQFLKAMVQADPSLQGLRLYVERENVVAQRVYAGLGMDGQHYRMFEWMKQDPRHVR